MNNRTLDELMTDERLEMIAVYAGSWTTGDLATSVTPLEVLAMATELRALRESHDALHGLLGEWMYEMGSDCHAGDEFRCENCLPCRSAAAWVAALEKAQAAAMEAQG